MNTFDLPVSRYMTATVLSAPQDTPLPEVQTLLLRHNVSALPLCDQHGHPVGLLSRTDLLRLGAVQARPPIGPALVALPDVPASAHMHRGIFSVGPAASVAQAARQLVHHRIHRLLVVERDLLAGVLGTRDVARAVVDAGIKTPATAYMSAPVQSVDVEDPLALALARLGEDHLSGLVVLDGRDPVGYFSQVEALRARDLPQDTRVGEVLGYAMLCLPAGALLYRAAAALLETRARRVLLIEDREVVGILTGLDLCRAAAAPTH